MHTVRIIDRGSAQQHGLVPVSGHDTSRRAGDDPGKPSVEEKRSYYWSGPGWVSAYNEARRLMATGLSVERAAAQVGWSKEELEEAIARDGKPPEFQPGADDDFKPRDRPRRTVKQRVAGLHGVSKETQDLARRLYEVENMTVREVAEALGEPYEKTYLILILASTKFRRPGRRGAQDKPLVKPRDMAKRVERQQDERIVQAHVVEKPRQAHSVQRQTVKPTTRPTVKPAPPPATRRAKTTKKASKKEAEKALRRVLGRKKEKPPVAQVRKKRVRKPAPAKRRKDMTEAERALRRVLG